MEQCSEINIQERKIWGLGGGTAVEFLIMTISYNFVGFVYFYVLLLLLITFYLFHFAIQADIKKALGDNMKESN